MIQARNYTPTAGRQIDLIVVHDMETPEDTGRAEAVAAWFAGPTAPKASAHRCFDNDSAVQCVLDKDVAWHAPGANHNGLGYEHAGRASQTRAQWLDPYGVAMLDISASQAAVDCLAYGLPVAAVDAAGLLRGERGITTHWEVTKAFRRSTHWDPGHEFPMGYYLDRVADHLFGQPMPPPVVVPVAAPGGILNRGDAGEAVRDWQRILAGAGLLPPAGIDGIFGPQTEAATRAFQAQLGVAADGIVGPVTREATARLLAWLAAARPIPEVPPFPGTVRRGDRGAVVSAVQTRLRDRGWPITVDGLFGSATERVVRAFQADKGLAVDGIAGPATWTALWASPIT